jgi:GNAT superfamily N-acetyltransferase
MTTQGFQIRPIDADSPREIEWVAQRMRETLIEVLSAKRGAEMYSMEWLVGRVQWHLDPKQVVGQVFVAIPPEGEPAGHTIVRVEDEDGASFGLFSTTWVEPAARKQGIATQLIKRGEAWMREKGLTSARTYTDKNNDKLQRLFLQHGYAMKAASDPFVQLSRELNNAA